MRKNIFLQIAVILTLVFASMLVVSMENMAADPQDQKLKFDNYRKAIKDTFQIDIKNFNDRLRGGYGDAKPITAYGLDQLLAGIKIEMEHTSNRFVALELVMDHLERIPDYYSRVLCRLERECVSDRLLQQ